MTSLANRRPRRFVNRPGPRAPRTPTPVPSFLHTRVHQRYTLRHIYAITHTYTHTHRHTLDPSIRLAPTRWRARARPISTPAVSPSLSLGIAPIACFSGARANKYPCGRLQGGLMELIKMCSINRTAACPSPPPLPPPPALTNEATHCVPSSSRIPSAILSRLDVEPDERNRIFTFR